MSYNWQSAFFDYIAHPVPLVSLYGTTHIAVMVPLVPKLIIGGKSLGISPLKPQKSSPKAINAKIRVWYPNSATSGTRRAILSPFLHFAS